MSEEKCDRIKTRAFGIFWRLTVFVLPWQTRWFRDASLGGWPWEQGRWSVYATMLLIVITVMLGVDRRSVKKPRSFAPWIVGAAFVALTLCTTLSVVATAEWWIEVMLLSTFVATLSHARVDGRALASWFAFSLIPQALLAIQQYLSGAVVATTWFGIAGQSPSTLGVAVVENGTARILRAYGGFPHPNILGGWMAVGLVAVLHLAATSSTKARALFWSACGALFSIALVSSFSRSAWLAAAIGVVALVVMHAVRSVRYSKQFLFLALFAILSIGGAVAYSQRAVVFSRVDLADRLEVKSADVRAQSLRDGWQLFLDHPWVGAGPNAELAALAPACGARCPAPLEPPHDVPLILLADVGLVGLGIASIGLWWSRRRWAGKNFPFLVTLGTLALFDHYLWSSWAGLCLFFISCGLATLDTEGELR